MRISPMTVMMGSNRVAPPGSDPRVLLAKAMARRATVVALTATPVIDQLVSRTIGGRAGATRSRSDRDAAQKAAGGDDQPARRGLGPAMDLPALRAKGDWRAGGKKRRRACRRVRRARTTAAGQAGSCRS